MLVALIPSPPRPHLPLRYAVLGFELGYALENPHALVVWEAQFGDFANGAQIMFDQFLSSSESKWGKQCGLTCLLPHGYDGQGPEHSSCRIERFLQMCGEDSDTVPDLDMSVTSQIQSHNWQVAYPSTPANYFHVLRRQCYRDFRKPLIVVAPKSLLRLRACTSSTDEFAEGLRFKRWIPEVEEAQLVAPKDMRRIVFCSGKIYYELADAREKNKIRDVAIVRLEQISPFPFDGIATTIAK